MKTKIFGVIAAAIFVLSSCTTSTSDEFCQNPGATCPDESSIEATSCCTDQDCYWIYNGSEYDCNGEDCTTAINQIVASACAGAIGYIDLNTAEYENLRAQMQAVTNRLLVDARAAAGCIY